MARIPFCGTIPDDRLYCPEHDMWMRAAQIPSRAWLQAQHGTVIRGCMTALGEMEIPVDDWSQVGANPFFAATAQGIDQKVHPVLVRVRSAQDVAATVQAAASALR